MVQRPHTPLWPGRYLYKYVEDGEHGLPALLHTWRIFGVGVHAESDRDWYLLPREIAEEDGVPVVQSRSDELTQIMYVCYPQHQLGKIIFLKLHLQQAAPCTNVDILPHKCMCQRWGYHWPFQLAAHNFTSNVSSHEKIQAHHCLLVWKFPC